MTYDQWKTDSGYSEVTPEQEQEREARDECKRRGLDPDDYAADGVLVWMVVDQEMREGCPKCGGDCSAANPPVLNCPLASSSVSSKDSQ